VIKTFDIETQPGDKRPIMKNKITEFAEGEGQAPEKKDKIYENFCLGLVNKNRVDAAVSKHGDEVLIDLNTDITPIFVEVLEDVKSEIDVD